MSFIKSKKTLQIIKNGANIVIFRGLATFFLTVSLKNDNYTMKRFFY